MKAPNGLFLLTFSLKIFSKLKKNTGRRSFQSKIFFDRFFTAKQSSYFCSQCMDYEVSSLIPQVVPLIYSRSPSSTVFPHGVCAALCGASPPSQAGERRGWLACTNSYSCYSASVEGPGISSLSLLGEREGGADLAVGPGLLERLRVL